MKLNQFFKANNLNLNNKTFLIAVSGGADSMALLTMVLDLQNEFNLRIIAAHVDHNLRADSFLESELLQKYANHNNFELIEKNWPKKLHPKTGIEAAARKFRYDFFGDIIEQEKVDYLLTAHHGDDLIENMLLKLIRSGNAAELNSLKPSRDFYGIKLLRPLLETEKHELVDFCRQRKISYIEDETNETDFTIRNRIRHHIIPLLKAESPKLIINTNRLQQGLDNQEHALIELIKQQIKVEPLINETVLKIKVSELQNFSATMVSLILQILIKQKFKKVIALPQQIDLRQPTKIDLPQQVLFQIYRETIYLADQELLLEYLPKDDFPIKLDQEFEFAGQKFSVSRTENSKINNVIGSFFASRDANLSIGRIKTSDRVVLKNQRHQLPKKKFAEQKIPEFLRPYQLTIFSKPEKQVVFISGVYQNQAITPDDIRYNVYQY